MNDEIVYGHITQTPGICGGRPRIAGHRIRVQDIVREYEQGFCPEEICAQHPGLELAEIFSAIAYYFDHRAAILEDLAKDEEVIAEFMRQHPDGAQKN